MDLAMDKDYYNRLINESIPYFFNKLNLSDKGIAQTALIDLAMRYLTLASLEHGLFGNKDQCKENLKLYGVYNFKFRKSTIIDDPNYKFPTTSFDEILYALSTGDPKFYLEYIKLYDDHADYDEKPTRHGSYWMYRGVVWIALDRNLDKVPEALEKAKTSFNPNGQYKAMYPYVLMLEAIWEKDEKKFHENLEITAKKYSRQINGTFDDTFDKFLCLYGIGLCQLAKYKGMKINFDHKYIPAYLIE